MVNQLFTFIKNSRIAKVVLAIVAIILTLTLLIPAFCNLIYAGVMAKLLTMILQSAVLIAVTGTSYFLLKSIIYKKYTGGRNLFIDQKLYKKDQFDLMASLERDPRNMDITTMPALPWRYCDGLIFGKKNGHTICKKSNADGNAIMFAAPGVGKTTGSAIPSALRFSGSVFAIDIKGDISSYTMGRRQIKFFNPDDNQSSHFDPLITVRNADSHNRGIAIENIANIIVPVKSKGEGEYFEKGAHDIFCGVVNYHIAITPEVTFPQIVQSILTSDAISWIKKIKTSNIMSAKFYTDGYYGSNEKNIAGCYGQLTTKLRPLTSLGYLATLLQPNGNEISPSDLESGTDIYLKISESRLATYTPIITLIVNSFIETLKDRQSSSSTKKMKPILMLLDEFCQMSLSPDFITSALATLRSRSVSVYMICQSLSQLRSRYGIQGATTIMDTCRYICIMSATDPEAQRYFSDLIGKRKTLKPMGQSSSETEEYIVRPEELSNLGDKVIILADGKYILADKIKCYEDISPMTEGTIKLRQGILNNIK